jgi:hypothetical protein
MTACSGSPEGSAPAPAAGGMAEGIDAPAPQKGPPQYLTLKRDVVKTASMTIDVTSTSEAADEAAVIVERADGRVDSRSEDAGSQSGRALTSIVLRVPAAKLDGVVRELKTLGTVQTAETTAEDVATQRVDLEARIKALQTSVDRLLAIMRDARDPDALIKAEEGALATAGRSGQSSRAARSAGRSRRLRHGVRDLRRRSAWRPRAAGVRWILGQIERGWDALVSVVGSSVLLFGLLFLPWLAVLAVLGTVGFVLIRLVRRTR